MGAFCLKADVHAALLSQGSDCSVPDCRRLVHDSGKNVLMRPWCVGSSQAGIPELLAESILAYHQRRAYLCANCELHVHLRMNQSLRDVASSRIFLCGGVSKHEGLGASLYSELRQLLPQIHRLRVETIFEPEHAVFRGGAKLAAEPDFALLCTKRSEWLEHGPRVCAARVKWNFFARNRGSGNP